MWPSKASPHTKVIKLIYLEMPQWSNKQALALLSYRSQNGSMMIHDGNRLNGYKVPKIAQWQSSQFRIWINSGKKADLE